MAGSNYHYIEEHMTTSYNHHALLVRTMIQPCFTLMNRTLLHAT